MSTVRYTTVFCFKIYIRVHWCNKLSYLRHFVLLWTQPYACLITRSLLKWLHFLTKGYKRCWKAGRNCNLFLYGLFLSGWRCRKWKVRPCRWSRGRRRVPTSIERVGKFMFMNWEICHKGYEWRGWIWNSVNNFLREIIFALLLCNAIFR